MKKPREVKAKYVLLHNTSNITKGMSFLGTVMQ